MQLKVYSLVAASAIAVASPAFSQPTAPSPADTFGAREAIRQASFSPSGMRLAVVAPYDQDGQLVRVYDLGQTVSQKIVMYNKEPDTDLEWCDWASEDNLVCEASITKLQQAKMLIRFTRLLTYSMKDGKLAALSVTPNHHAIRLNQKGGDVLAWHVDGQAPGAVLVSRDYVPEGETGSNISKVQDGMGVEQVDLATMSRHNVERARRDAIEYMADEHGKVRLLELQPSDQDGYLKDEVQYFYRPKDGGDWQKLKLGANAPDDFEPFAVDSALNVAYGVAKHDGFASLYTVSLDGAAKGELVLTHPGADIDELIQIGNGGRVVGARYATDRRQVEFFDPELKKLTASLQKALPGGPQVEILDASDDGSRLLLVASSDTNPGTLYSFDKKTHKLEELLPLRPELAGMTMGTMKAITYPAADGTAIPGYLTLPPGSSGKKLPAIVMPHGGPGDRDVWGFDWLVQYFVHLGYAVLQPNFRGSSGYGNAWFEKNGFQSWPMAIGDVDDAGRWLVSQGIADPAKLAIVGWSYGGYAALQSQVVAPDLYKAVVAIAPVTDLDRLRAEHRDFTDYEIVNAFIGQGPHVEAGSPARHASAFKAPVLLFHGDHDENVSVDESRLMNSRLKEAGKSVHYIEFPNLDHQIDDATQRPRMLREIAAFLDTSLKG
jgi:dipeptidyl aminopeptidase/acylaminoacyl peptidase